MKRLLSLALGKTGSTETWRGANDTALEQYLADLALQKGVINTNSHAAIRKAMETARKD